MKKMSNSLNFILVRSSLDSRAACATGEAATHKLGKTAVGAN
jgi:hypothetical protein